MPTWMPDFENTHANVVVQPQMRVQLSLEKLTGFAYDREKDNAHLLGINATLKIVGKYDSKGKLNTTDYPAGEEVERIRLWMHSEGGLKMTKRILMAFAGFGLKEEKEYNAWAAKQDFGIEQDENDEGGYDVTLHEGWNVFIGKHADVELDKKMYQPKDDSGANSGEPQEQQDYKSWSPVGAKK